MIRAKSTAFSTIHLIISLSQKTQKRKKDPFPNTAHRKTQKTLNSVKEIPSKHLRHASANNMANKAHVSQNKYSKRGDIPTLLW